ncbi:MAG: glycogen debranching enzyme [Deltaproteobacteria bacterium]|nr:MAG: glycogen debranching enzyme [Deltaproteobacteria bacterium]
MNNKNNKTVQRGYPLPPGPSCHPEGINFSIFSRNATAVSLVIEYEDPNSGKKVKEYFALDPQNHRTGDMWHILLPLREGSFTYGYQISDGSASSKEKTTLLDPYARALLPRRWEQTAAYGEKPCCRIGGDDFDWQGDRPPKTPLADTIIYELHVRGFTRHPTSQVEAPGTYSGLIEKIPYLQKLGITAVELMPVCEFDENDIVFHNPQTAAKLTNFWGYSPISFFALHPGYAKNPEQAVTEFKTLVRALHKAGIEVYLDMVYNHTGENGYDGRTSSLRGIDNSIYYLLDEDGGYHNFSGCGNTCNCNHPIVRNLIRDSLHYWVMEMHVDGFRFDLASILGRDQDGTVMPDPPMIEIIEEDPVLRDTKIIAEAWDAAGLYQVGSFSTSPRWAEWNGRFRDDLRAFMIGRPGEVAHLATRIAGSSDLYEKNGRSPLSSINFVTSHDGFTLYDLVSYKEKHNLDNGEDNRDGDSHNISDNCGAEGQTDNPEIQALRLTKIKTFAVILFISQGVPMLLAGDEFGRSQRGNNNAWCQDNETSWIDWSLLKSNRGLFRFFKNCIGLRKRYKVFRMGSFFHSLAAGGEQSPTAEIQWQYLEPGQQNWSRSCHGLAFRLYASRPDSADFFVAFNNGPTALRFKVPKLADKRRNWCRIIDSTQRSPHDFCRRQEAPLLKRKTITVPPFGCIMLQKK